MRSGLSELFEQLLQLLFPDCCAGCGRTGALWCERCRGSLQGYPAEPAPAGLDGATVGWIYQGSLRHAVHRLKYGRERRVAQPLGELLASCLATQPQPADALLAVPLHAGRLAERGFNQSEELARWLGRRCGLPLLSHGLERGRDTGHQAGLNRSERQSNIAGAFVWRATRPPPARVLLVDDVLTTGATLVACATALRAAGAHEVRAVALARSLAPGQRAKAA